MHLHTYESTNGQSMSRIKINSFPIGLLKTNYTRALNVLCCASVRNYNPGHIYERFCMYRDIVHFHSQSNFIEMWCVWKPIRVSICPVRQSVNQSINLILLLLLATAYWQTRPPSTTTVAINLNSRKRQTNVLFQYHWWLKERIYFCTSTRRLFSLTIIMDICIREYDILEYI